jgi:hypothetical protein
MIDKYNYTDVNNNRNSELLVAMIERYEEIYKKYQKQCKILLEIEKIIHKKNSYMSKVIAIYDLVREK